MQEKIEKTVQPVQPEEVKVNVPQLIAELKEKYNKGYRFVVVKDNESIYIFRTVTAGERMKDEVILSDKQRAFRDINNPEEFSQLYKEFMENDWNRTMRKALVYPENMDVGDVPFYVVQKYQQILEEFTEDISVEVY